jgi:hypothetical protein
MKILDQFKHKLLMLSLRHLPKKINLVNKLQYQLLLQMRHQPTKILKALINQHKLNRLNFLLVFQHILMKALHLRDRRKLRKLQKKERKKFQEPHLLRILIQILTRILVERLLQNNILKIAH